MHLTFLAQRFLNAGSSQYFTECSMLHVLSRTRKTTPIPPWPILDERVLAGNYVARSAGPTVGFDLEVDALTR
jgi:hypothetical protein